MMSNHTAEESQDAMTAKFAAVVGRVLDAWPDWQAVDWPGLHPRLAVLRHGLVEMTLRVLPERQSAQLNYTVCVPSLGGDQTTLCDRNISLRYSVAAVAGKLMGAIADALPQAQARLADYVGLVKRFRHETATLHTVWQLLGGAKPSYTFYHCSAGSCGAAEIGVSVQECNRFNLDARNLTNREVLAIAQLLAARAFQPVAPHPRDTLKVNELGIVYCVDVVTAPAQLIHSGRPNSLRPYAIIWKLEDDEWNAYAQLDHTERHILTHCGSSFPTDDAFAEAAATLAGHLAARQEPE
jgi:hypothetical protein